MIVEAASRLLVGQRGIVSSPRAVDRGFKRDTSSLKVPPGAPIHREPISIAREELPTVGRKPQIVLS